MRRSDATIGQKRHVEFEVLLAVVAMVLLLAEPVSQDGLKGDHKFCPKQAVGDLRLTYTASAA